MNKLTLTIAVLAVVLLVAAGWYFSQHAPEAPAEPVSTVDVTPPPVVETQVEPEIAEPEFVIGEKRSPAPEPLAELPLPPLAESDAYVGETLSTLLGEAAVMQYFASEGVVSRTVATIDALSSRQVPGNIQAVQAPAGSFSVVENPSPDAVLRNEAGDVMPQYLSNPDNSRRYVAYVEMLEAVDPQTFAKLYRKHYPMFQQAWRELGYPDGDFDRRLREVINELMITPDVSEPLRLYKPEAVYLFVDEHLESLSAGQKIMLRMGNENATRVKSWLSEVQRAL